MEGTGTANLRSTVVNTAAAVMAAAALFGGLSACGSDGAGDDSQQAQTATEPTRLAGGPEAGAECTPTVMVVRHAEDEANPDGGGDILSSVGIRHADLYPKLFRDYLATVHSIGPDGAEVSACPIGRVVAIDPEPNPQNRSPGSNPYETIEPLSDDLGLPVETEDAAGVSYSTVYEWDTARRRALLDNGSSTPTSTVIAWDKGGLNPSVDDLSTKTINGKRLADYDYVPLLKALPAAEDAIVGSGTYTPQRTDFYVFSVQDPESGAFASAKAYTQVFSEDGGSTWSPSPTADSNDIKTASR
jgi:hypothetical protein